MIGEAAEETQGEASLHILLEVLKRGVEVRCHPVFCVLRRTWLTRPTGSGWTSDDRDRLTLRGQHEFFTRNHSLDEFPQMAFRGV